MSDLKELKLMRAVAASLVGETVLIAFVDPIISDFVGQAYLTHAGVKAINITPSLDDEKKMKVFLHEVFHHYAGHTDAFEPLSKEIEKANVEHGAFLNLEWDEEQYKKYKNRPEELEANNFSSELSSYAKRKAEETFGNASLENCLRVLMNISILKGD